MSNILIISSDIARANNLSTILTFLGEPCSSVLFPSAIETLKSKTEIKSVLIDAATPELASDISEKFPQHPFVLVGNYQAFEPRTNIVGAISEPITYPELTQMLHRCQEYKRSQPNVKTSVHNKTRLFRSLIGKSKQIQGVRHLIEQVAPTEANVLILGESGTGKEVIARNVHFLSNRTDSIFIPVNCGAIPGELLESELFGHEKGAFTGAVNSRKGRFELAEGGTLFLDEIGDMPLQMQVKLLRVLQERTYERVGGTKPIKCNVRVIAATHRDLEVMIEEGQFREDLYYRLNVFPIDSPALRERTEDIPLLLQELVSRLELDNAQIKFTANAMASLMEHKWAGNVRELSNLVERLMILYPNQLIDVSDLPNKYNHLDIAAYEPEYPDELLERDAINAMFGGDDVEDSEEVDTNIDQTLSTELPVEGLNLKEYISELEVNLITQALEQQDWVVARAAETLGMRRTTLVEKMRKYNISKD
ncbi:sigma-54 dependent transcriptional regulator [uncultured Paraglaciecola sp.]|uniref:sigma-54 interaction domain-containing protein n=1 Tax=uncultured Paraglaciecola sp. TaxID=1765024 RepID=UPI0030DB85DD|tara:strand:- start:59320 stop:60756 length:1437 start_codon:yes stop_codon:yes gene_type:complete